MAEKDNEISLLKNRYNQIKMKRTNWVPKDEYTELQRQLTEKSKKIFSLKRAEDTLKAKYAMKY